MIPLFAVIQFHQPSWFWRQRIWFPLFLVWMLLLPVLILISPVFLLVCLVAWVNPVRAGRTFIEILSALKGTQVEVKFPDYAVDISIR